MVSKKIALCITLFLCSIFLVHASNQNMPPAAKLKYNKDTIYYVLLDHDTTKPCDHVEQKKEYLYLMLCSNGTRSVIKKETFENSTNDLTTQVVPFDDFKRFEKIRLRIYRDFSISCSEEASFIMYTFVKGDYVTCLGNGTKYTVEYFNRNPDPQRSITISNISTFNSILNAIRFLDMDVKDGDTESTLVAKIAEKEKINLDKMAAAQTIHKKSFNAYDFFFKQHKTATTRTIAFCSISALTLGTYAYCWTKGKDLPGIKTIEPLFKKLPFLAARHATFTNAVLASKMAEKTVTSITEKLA